MFQNRLQKWFTSGRLNQWSLTPQLVSRYSHIVHFSSTCRTPLCNLQRKGVAMIDIVYSDLNEVRRSYQNNGVIINRPLWFNCVLLLSDMRMTIRINVVPLDYFWRPSSDPNSTLPLININKHRTRRLRPPNLTLHPTFSIYRSHTAILIGLEKIKTSLSIGDVVRDADCRQSKCRKGLYRHRRQPESRFSDRHRM